MLRSLSAGHEVRVTLRQPLDTYRAFNLFSEQNAFDRVDARDARRVDHVVRAFAPDAVAHFRPRGSLSAFFKQYYRYARGDGKADLWRKRHAIRYLTYLAAAPLILLLGILVHPLLWLLALPGAAVYLYQPYRRLPIVLKRLPRVSTQDWLYAIVLVPVICVVGDAAKMIGYPVGWLWRLRHHPPNWRV